MRSPCLRCGTTLHTGEAKVLMGFSADELAQMVHEVSDDRVRQRLLCALGTIDPERERAERALMR